MALLNRAIAYNKIGNTDLAIQDYSQIISLGGDTDRVATALNNRGNIYRRLNKFDLALRDFDKALEVKPGYSLAISNKNKLPKLQQSELPIKRMQ
jgi:tetratricopeptide (TPR) repeat protein